MIRAKSLKDNVRKNVPKIPLFKITEKKSVQAKEK